MPSKTAGVLEMVQGHCEGVKYKHDRVERDLGSIERMTA
jgi:hypothetical protein